MPHVKFYILPAKSQEARIQFISKLAQQLLPEQKMLLLTDNVAALDETLWREPHDGFLPHEVLVSEDQYEDDVLLYLCDNINKLPPQSHAEFAVALLSPADSPQALRDFHFIIEILPDDETILAEGRQRYKHYKQLSFEIDMHDLRKR